MSRTNVDLSMLSYMPLQSQWLDTLPAYGSSNAQVVRACMSMLLSAFHAKPTGTLVNSVQAVAQAAKIPDTLALEHFALLTAGYKVEKDKLIFEPLKELGARLDDQYREKLQALQDHAILSMTAPSLFDDQANALAAVSDVSATTRSKAVKMAKKGKSVKHNLPEDSGLTEGLVKFLLKHDFNSSRHDDIWQRFADYVQAEGVQAVDWQAKFRTWLRLQMKWESLVPDSQLKAVSQAGSRTFNFKRTGHELGPTRGEVAEMRSAERLSQVERATGRVAPRPTNFTAPDFSKARQRQV